MERGLNTVHMRYSLIERCNRVTDVSTGMAPFFQQKIKTSTLLDYMIQEPSH